MSCGFEFEKNDVAKCFQYIYICTYIEQQKETIHGAATDCWMSYVLYILPNCPKIDFSTFFLLHFKKVTAILTISVESTYFLKFYRFTVSTTYVLHRGW
jgi:hypothetical protein